MGRKFYITTTAPYVNSDPHLGFALEIIQADVVARYQKLLGNDVVFGFGTDEHGQKIYQKALEQNKTPQEYCDETVLMWDKLKPKLNISYTNFIRTTDKKHILAAQELWNRCFKNGDIYKKTYKSKYCVGCELEKTDSELDKGVCPTHPNLKIELIDEENYFFQFSKYQKPLLDLYKQNPEFVVPQHRLTEIKNFVEGGLQDFSISRLKEKMPWGIDIPNDSKQVMYVWFDALTFYLSNLDWPKNEESFNNYWPVIQVAGKDNLRQQSAIWQAMLMSAGLPTSKQIFIHGFITSEGQKMSKSLGNVINPIEYVEKYGTDALRYYLLAKVSPTEDSDFTKEKFEEVYNGDLANGLGNLISRIAKLAEKSGFEFNTNVLIHWYEEVESSLVNYRFDEALKFIWQKISKLDQKINQEEPWKLEGDKLKEFLNEAIKTINHIAYNLQPFLPDTAEKIKKQFQGPKIKSAAPLFPRLI